MTKGVDEKIDESVLGWFDHVERMENDRIAKSVYVGECAGRCSVGRPSKRWIDTVKKRGCMSDIHQWLDKAWSVRRGFVRGNAWGFARGMNR